MKKIFIILIVMLAFSVNSMYAGAKAKTSKPIAGVVIDLKTYVKGNAPGTVTKEEAKKVVDEGGTLALLTTDKKPKVYFICNENGSSATKKLIDLAGKPLGITGKVVTKGGVSVIFATIIDVMK